MLSRNRYRQNKKDANHDQVVAWFRDWGWGVEETWRFGHGFPDVIIHNPRVTVLVEIKNGHEPLTEAEERFMRRFTGPNALVWDEESALAAHRRFWNWRGE